MRITSSWTCEGAEVRDSRQQAQGFDSERCTSCRWCRYGNWAIHSQTPTAERLFADDTVLDPEGRLLKANGVMHDFVWGNQMQMRPVLARLLDQAPGASDGPARIASSEPSYGINSRRPLSLRATASTNPPTASYALRSRR